MKLFLARGVLFNDKYRSDKWKVIVVPINLNDPHGACVSSFDPQHTHTHTHTQTHTHTYTRTHTHTHTSVLNRLLGWGTALQERTAEREMRDER
jgi:ABC-type nickel/cobalt efflux system permease component RcnA